MFGEPQKEAIVIVEAKNCGKYSKQLYNLIGSDSTASNDGGSLIRDIVEASILDETKFINTPLSSDQLIVFVGSSKAVRDYVDAIAIEARDCFDKYGVHIHLSGKQASISVDSKAPTKEEYWAFLDFAESEGVIFDDLLVKMKKQDEHSEKTNNEVTGEEPINDEKKLPAPIGKAQDAFMNIADAAAIRTKLREINDQRFRFAIKYFFLRKLRVFLGA